MATDADLVGTCSRDGRGCPECAEYGYSPCKPAYFFLMSKPGEQQIGITNSPSSRISLHQNNGWQLAEITPAKDGKKVLDTETLFKRWLKKNCSPVPGHTENWFTRDFEVNSLAELKKHTGIETDIF